MFEHASSTVLINVSGRERGYSQLPNGGPAGHTFEAWGIGIGRSMTRRGNRADQVRELMDLAGLQYADPSVRVLAAYSTGYRGMIQSINNDLLPLDDLARVIFFDCLYRADTPALPPGASRAVLLPEELNTGPDELEQGRPVNQRPFNTRRALSKVLARQPRADLIAYSVTMGGSPLYLAPTTADPVQHEAFVPSLIEFRDIPTTIKTKTVPAERRTASILLNNALTALIVTRYLSTGLQDGFFTENAVPQGFRELLTRIPRRGEVASSERTAQARGVMPLKSWQRAHADRIRDALKEAGAARSLIDRHELILPGASPAIGEQLHRGFVPEFGWEFLL
ncbi:hypothetical protein [Streptomyces sp. BF23-19]|uniref:hypothetical protein n=1 Tax=unclassified Streptomyces TaxID=2593676 RepID=UPI0034E6106F